MAWPEALTENKFHLNYVNSRNQCEEEGDRKEVKWKGLRRDIELFCEEPFHSSFLSRKQDFQGTTIAHYICARYVVQGFYCALKIHLEVLRGVVFGFFHFFEFLFIYWPCRKKGTFAGWCHEYIVLKFKKEIRFCFTPTSDCNF